jgi:hypothetical protein
VDRPKAAQKNSTTFGEFVKWDAFTGRTVTFYFRQKLDGEMVNERIGLAPDSLWVEDVSNGRLHLLLSPAS